MAESMQGLKRTHRCAELSAANVGETVTIMGWVQKNRNKGGLVFIDVRDRSGIIQVVCEEGKTDAVSGVSISVNGFISLAQQCLDQAAGIESAADGAASQNGTQVDGVSGATRSSTAAVNGINDAYNFLQTVK